MKSIIITLIFLSSFIFACDGDCIKCHPKLLKNGKLDDNHKVLKNCINCHQVSDDDLQKMGAACGQDCWSCHSIDKVMNVRVKDKTIDEHSSLSSCIDCHIKLQLNNTKSIFSDF